MNLRFKYNLVTILELVNRDLKSLAAITNYL